MSDNFLDEIGKAEAKVKRPSPSHKQITNPLEAIPATEVRRATHERGKDPSMVGQQLRRSILIPPEMDEEINRICKRYKIKKMEMMRFLIAKGLEDVHNGALERNLVKRVVVELPEPQWKSVR
jgi:predicted DNA-binding protein